ncbi:MAG: hypothetical protein M3N14_11005 [Bacteroidota bacterium]|nr:hypothetical protein [Bacteroidota bacterium]
MQRIVFIAFLLCLGCSHKQNVLPVKADLVDNGRSVKFSGLDYAIVSEINRDSTAGLWQGLIPVYRMPADTDVKDYQPVQPGKYRLRDRAVVFTPDTPFVKNQTYFMRYYKFDGGEDVWDLVKGKKKLGRPHYIDLIFK